jgi:hypothetical protein
MLSFEPTTANHESRILPSKNLTHKLEQFTNRFLDGMKTRETSDSTSWKVVDLNGRVIAMGAIPEQTESTEFLF